MKMHQTGKRVDARNSDSMHDEIEKVLVTPVARKSDI